VGAGYRVTSGGLRILMDQPTEPISSHDPRRRRQGNWDGGSEASPVPADRHHHRQGRSRQEQDEGSDDRQTHHAEDSRADTSANGKTCLSALGLSLCLENEPPGFLDLQGCHRPSRVTARP
jgi:hypothetical protein